MTTKTTTLTKADQKRLQDLNDQQNLARKVKKSGERRRTPKDDIGDSVSARLTQAETPSEVGTIATEFGLTVADVLETANKAPNWGQFRMVIGNRIRGVQNRLDEFDGDFWAAAHPQEARRKAREADKAAKAKTTKKVTKKAAKKATPAAKAPRKKVTKKAASKVTPGKARKLITA